MNSSVGSSLLLYIVIIVVGVVGSVFIASNNYSKAAKAKNNIISIIDNNYVVNHGVKFIGNSEKEYKGDCFVSEEGTTSKDKCVNKIATTLKDMGYKMNNANICSNYFNAEKYDEITYPKDEDTFLGYCVFKKCNDDTCDAYYYTVLTFSHMNINIMGVHTLYKTPVYGQTRTFYN